MALRRPSTKDILDAAAVNCLDLTEEDIEGFHSLMPDIFQLLDSLEQMPVDIPRLEGVIRDPGCRPRPEDDPYNAIVRRCSVKGSSNGKLAGVRVGLKDYISVAGVPMTAGSRVLSGYVPDTDATVVSRLLSEGAEIVAILNMDDLAWAGGGDTSAYGPILNPHNTRHLPAGSSGGSGTALYYDDIDMTLGTDEGGSVRHPASWCGVVGLKATFGLVPYTGIVGGESTLDHVGPMARSAGQVARMLEVIAGKDGLDPKQGEIPTENYTEALDGKVEGLRIGVVKEGFEREVGQQEVNTAVRKALSEISGLKIETKEISLPIHARDALAIYQGISVEGGGAILRDRGRTYGWQGFYNAGMNEAFGKGLQTNANDMTHEAKLLVLSATYLSSYYHGRMYAKGQNLRNFLRSKYDEALEEFDVLAMPTMVILPFENDPSLDWRERVARDYNHITLNTCPFNATGHPAISIPCGKVNGLPVGLMLIGKHFQEATLLKIADAFEKNFDWEKL